MISDTNILKYAISLYSYQTLKNNPKPGKELLSEIYYILGNMQFATKLYQAQCGTNAKNFNLMQDTEKKSHWNKQQAFLSKYT